MKLKQLLLAFIIMLIITSSSGCLDVQLGKEIFGRRAITPERYYKIVEKATLEYTFTTLVPEEHTDSASITIILGTYSMRVNIKVTIEPPVEFGKWGERYVTVRITKPDHTIYDERTYNDSADETILIEPPTLVQGTWVVKVEALGSGDPTGTTEFNDSYSVKVWTKEPV